MARHRAFRLILALIGILPLLFPAVASAQNAKLAAALSLTGSDAVFGDDARDGALLAVEEANKTGAKPQIDLSVYDDASNLERGHDVIRQIIASDALAVVGPVTTPMTLAVGPDYEKAGIAGIATQATGDTVTNSTTIFRASFSTTDVGEWLANYLHYVLGGTRAIVLFTQDGYGQLVADGFATAAQRLNIATAYRPISTPAEEEQAARSAASDPNHPAIVLAMISQAPTVLATLRRAGATGPMLGTNTIAGDFFADFFKDMPEERDHPGYFTDGVYAASPLILDSANAETLAFADRFRARFGREPPYAAAQGYEAALLAIAAVRATAGDSDAADVTARRSAIRNYLVSLNGPAHSVAGLNGPLWFTPERGRDQVLRIGRFHGTQFESAPSQLVPVANATPAEMAAGTVFDVGAGRFARRQQVVYTGMYLNEISGVDPVRSTFNADFYLWMRFAADPGLVAADPADIAFDALGHGDFDPAHPAVERQIGDGTVYRLWQVRAEFRNPFDFRRYPFDSQELAIRFFNARAASDQIVYAHDRRAADIGAATTGNAVATGVAPHAFRELTQWGARQTIQRRDSLVAASALGDPRLAGLGTVRELSGFNLSVQLERRALPTVIKSLLPLGVMTLMLFASLYIPTIHITPKVVVPMTLALSAVVLLSSINARLGDIGYVIAVEYGFYIFFALSLLCLIVAVAGERLRMANRPTAVVRLEHAGEILFALAVVGTFLAAWLFYVG